jgi:hypothetical protein
MELGSMLAAEAAPQPDAEGSGGLQPNAPGHEETSLPQGDTSDTSMLSGEQPSSQQPSGGVPLAAVAATGLEATTEEEQQPEAGGSGGKPAVRTREQFLKVRAASLHAHAGVRM